MLFMPVELKVDAYWIPELHQQNTVLTIDCWLLIGQGNTVSLTRGSKPIKYSIAQKSHLFVGEVESGQVFLLLALDALADGSLDIFARRHTDGRQLVLRLGGGSITGAL